LLGYDAFGYLYDLEFWPSWEIEDYRVEPDAVLFDATEQVIIVEAKRYDKSRQQDAHQLANEILASSNMEIKNPILLIIGGMSNYDKKEINNIKKQIDIELTKKSYKGSYRNIVVKPAMYSTYATGDVRKDVIIQGASNTFRYMLNKYPNTQGSDNIKLIRYEEVLLNGVEAELNGGSAATALQYYNQILTNRGLTAATSVSMTELKAERAKELIGEGFRLWDLLRWGDTTTPLLGKTTNVNLLAFPIPRVITDLDGSLIKANPSYDNYQ